MPLLNGRKARIGTIVTIILLISIVMFIGSLFWLTVNGPWNVELGLARLITPTKTTPDNNQESTNATKLEPSLTKAVNILKIEGCRLAPYEKYIDLAGAKQLTFNEFKEKALENGIVLIIPDDVGETVLLIIDYKTHWIWKP